MSSEPGAESGSPCCVLNTGTSHLVESPPSISRWGLHFDSMPSWCICRLRKYSSMRKTPAPVRDSILVLPLWLALSWRACAWARDRLREASPLSNWCDVAVGCAALLVDRDREHRFQVWVRRGCRRWHGGRAGAMPSPRIGVRSAKISIVAGVDILCWCVVSFFSQERNQEVRER